MRVFLDANILFSAAWKEGADASLLFELAAAGFCELTTSHLAVEEARRNIARKRPVRRPALEQFAGRALIGREPGESHLAVARAQELPDKDIPILAAAIAQGADLLVTGDRRDFGHLYGSGSDGVEVINLSGAIERILAALA
ncbi:MAG: PIN domain-containing protein [Wenzhouxiangellaceae bacterium]|nr:PIN domain-containing protein [Wenzhouxiangellaceae bacterium]